MTHKILILRGDGIGPEIMAEAEKVLAALVSEFGLRVEIAHGLVGGASFDANGRPLTDETLAQARQADAVLFGATILGRGIAPNLAARALLDLYNAKGVFNNRGDDLASLSDGLRQRFDQVEIGQQGLVALFRVR